MAMRFSLPVVAVIILVEAVVVAFIVAFAQQIVIGRSMVWLTSVITTMTVIITLQALRSH